MINFEGNRNNKNISSVPQTRRQNVQRQSEFRLYDAETGNYIALKRPQTDDGFEKSQVRQKRPQPQKPHMRKAPKRKTHLPFLTGAVGLITAASVILGTINGDTNKKIESETQNSQSGFVAVVEESNTPRENEIDKILNENEDVKSAYDNINEALDTFSSQMGTDGLELIRQRTNEITNGEIDTAEILKILWIESRGRVYDDNGNYITGYTNEAFGPFQLTPDTVDYLNNYYGLNLDVMNPYDNLDACIYNLMFLKDLNEQRLEENGELLTGNDVMRAVFWNYHDGAWADDITKQGEDYLAMYDELSAIDEYAALYEESGLC